jgi:hypothetical protein
MCEARDAQKRVRVCVLKQPDQQYGEWCSASAADGAAQDTSKC